MADARLSITADGEVERQAAHVVVRPSAPRLTTSGQSSIRTATLRIDRGPEPTRDVEPPAKIMPPEMRPHSAVPAGSGIAGSMNKHASGSPFQTRGPTERRSPACILEWDSDADLGSHSAPIHTPNRRPSDHVRTFTQTPTCSRRVRQPEPCRHRPLRVSLRRDFVRHPSLPSSHWLFCACRGVARCLMFHLRV